MMQLQKSTHTGAPGFGAPPLGRPLPPSAPHAPAARGADTRVPNGRARFIMPRAFRENDQRGPGDTDDANKKRAGKEGAGATAAAVADADERLKAVWEHHDALQRGTATRRAGPRSYQERKEAKRDEGTWPRGKTLAMVLGGGESDRRLFPLTAKRALPALPVAGSYRLIDIPLSSLMQSGINKIYLLTQYNSHSLNRYINYAYNIGPGVPYGGDGFTEVLATSQNPTSSQWNEGTADAVRQMRWLLETGKGANGIEEVMILPADQLYRTDFSRVIMEHRKRLADVTIVCHAEPAERVYGRLGLVRVAPDDPSLRVTAYAEKPTPGTDLDDFRLPPKLPFASEDDFRRFDLANLGAPSPGSSDAPYLASTGIYVFNRPVLLALLKEHPMAHNLGGELVPAALQGQFEGQEMRVHASLLPGYWRDVGGSVRDYLDAQVEHLTSYEQAEAGKAPAFPSDPQRAMGHAPGLPLITGVPGGLALPAAALNGARLRSSSVSAGVVLAEGCVIEHSIIGPRAIIREGVRISGSVVMGADYYEDEKEGLAPSPVPMGIGANTVIEGAVIDKNARIGANCVLVNKERVAESMERVGQGLCIREGVVVVTKSACLPDGTMV